MLGNLYRALLSMDISANSIELIQKETEEESWTDYILRWPVIHTRYKELGRYDFEQYDYSLFGRGEAVGWTVGWSYPLSSELLNNTEAGILSDANREWLESLVELAQEENFELIFFVAPFYYDDAETRELYNAAREFAENNGIPYFDFNELAEEISLDYNTDFADSTHCNANGAEKVTAFFGEYFAENMDLEDHRGDERYYLWDEDLEYYKSLVQEQALAAALNSSVREYAETIAAGSNLSYVITLNGNYVEYIGDIAQLLEPLGINVYEYLNGGKWIYADGELHFIMDNSSVDSYTYDLDDFVTVRIENVSLMDSEASVFEDVKVNGEAQTSVYDGVYIMVYDTLQHEFISTLAWN
ncbi:MAG: SGNH/GDSL hydrolase family protein [Lachnospiraceae bacterium]|nr:SGNH/GDSL hydrolase family protein [Lachnospiraceae bacterium]